MVRRRAAAAIVMVIVSGSGRGQSHIQDFCVVGIVRTPDLYFLFSGKGITYKR
jgi:hypothetical protein